MIIGENTQIEGSLEVWTSATISSAGVGSFQSLEVSPTGLKFPNDAFGGGLDSAGMRLVSRGGENQSLEIYTTNDANGDWVNLVVPSVNDAKVNGNTIWNAGNLTQTSIDNWNTAYTSAHNHANKSTIDLINQSLATSASPSFNQIITTSNGNGENIRVGDDTWIGDVNSANTLKIMGVQDETKGYVRIGNDANALGYNGSYLTYTGPMSFGPAGTKYPNTYSKYVFNVGDNDYNGIDIFAERSDKSVFISLGTQSNSNSTWGIQKRDDGAYGTTVGCFSIEDGSASFVVERFPISVVAGDSGSILLNRNIDVNSGKRISVVKDVNPSVGDNPWLNAPILINRASTSGTDNSNVAGIGFHNQGTNASLFYYDPAAAQFKYRRHSGGTTQTFWDSGNFNPNNYSLTGHIHDDRYYTESESNTLLAAKLNRVPTLSVGSDANSFTTNGVWMGYNITNATTAGWVVIRVYRGPDDVGDVIWQEELDQNNSTTYRRKSTDFGATWSSWTRFLDTVNDATSIANWNTAYGNTHTHNQTLNTNSDVTFNTVTTSEYKFSSSTSKLGLHGDNFNLKVSLDNSSGGVGLLPQGTVTSANALLGRWDYRWKVVYGGLGNFDSIEEGGVSLSSKYLRLIGDTMTGSILFGTVGNNAGSPALNFNGTIPTDGYKWIIGDTSNSTGFSIYANGATRSTDGGVNSVNIRSERGPLNLGFASQTTNLIGNNVQANGNSIWHAGNFDPSTKQNSISKTVFETTWGNGAATAGWCKLGTYAGNSTSRFTFIITGKAGWNDQNYASQAIIHGGTNYIASDVGQIAAGCKWNEFAGSSETASQIRLVRQSGYNPYTFDLYVLNDNNYVNWTVDVTHQSCSWTTGIAWQQVDPGTGTNVFQPTKRTVWETSNFDPANYSLTSHSHDVKDLAWTTLRYDDILNHVKNGITDSPTGNDGMFTGNWAYHFKMVHSGNPNDWQFLLAADFFTDSIGFRRKASGSWQAPQYLWHTGNFSQTNINNWNTAYTNNHTHTNKANLDTINQNLGTTSNATFSTLYLTSNGSSNNLRFGDDVLLGDIDWENTVNVRGIQNGNYGYIRFGTDSTSLGYNQTSLNYGGRFDVTQIRAGSSTFCVVASTTNSDIWNDQGGSYSIHISNGQGFNFYQGTPGAGSPIAGINSNGTINSQSLTASRVVVSDTSKNLISSNITTTELGHLAGTSANIQTQINQLASASVSGVGAGTVNRVSKFTTGTGIGDSNINDDGSTISFLTHITGSTAAFTGGLNVGADGIRFPDNAFGGGGDFAWIRLISKGGEAQSMELYVGNDADDWVNLVGPDNNFAKVNGNTIWNAGNLTQTSINNWNTAYTSAHFHTNKSNLDTINQNLSTTSQVTFADVSATGAAYVRYGYFGTHSGWVNGTYAMRVYGDSIFIGNATVNTDSQLFLTKDVTPTTALNTNYSSAPLVINRTSITGTSTAAGLGFHNQGVNAAFLYYDATTSVFKYNRNTAGALVTIWDDSNFTPGNYLPKSGSFGGSDGYIFEIESGSDSGGLSLRLTDNSDGTEYFVVRNNAGDPSLIANSDRTVNIGYQNYQQVKPILSIGDQQYGIGANSGYLDLYSAGGGFRAFSKSGSSDAVFVGNFWHSGNFNPSSKSDAGHTHSILNITDRVSQYVDDNYDVGTAKYLRWKNYGDGHEIIDASQGLSPTGSTISNGNSDMPWAPTYPTLMGWNGVNTYGVRVDRSRYSDNADVLEGHAASYFATAGHNHDDRYYTESETNLLLSDKSNVGHTHDDRYYTESESDSRFLGIYAISNVISGSGYTNRIPVFNSEKTLTSYSSLYYIVGGSYNDNVLNILHNENTHGGSLINLASGLYSGDSAVKLECSTGSARLSTDYGNKNFYLRTDCDGATSYPLNIHLHTSGAVTVNRLLAIASSTMVVPTNTGGNLQFSNNGGNTSFNYYAGSSVTNYGHRFHVNDGGGAYSLMMSVDKYALNVYGNIVVSGGSTYGMVSYSSSTTIGNDVTLAVIENTGSSITLTLPAPSNGKKLYVISMDSIGSPNPHRISPPTGCSLRIVNSSNTNSTIIPSSPLIITGRAVLLIAVSSTEWIRIQ